MSRAPFLTTPAAWTRAARQSADPIDYACAIKHTEESAIYRGLRAAVCIAAAVLIGWLAAQGA